MNASEWRAVYRGFYAAATAPEKTSRKRAKSTLGKEEQTKSGRGRQERQVLRLMALDAFVGLVCCWEKRCTGKR